MAAAQEKRIIELVEGWNYMQLAVTKLKNITEGLPEPAFTAEEYMNFYTVVYTMCTQLPPHGYSWQLYEKYREVFEEYIAETVLPSLRDKHDEILLREFAKQWKNNQLMIYWLSRFFNFLERMFIQRFLLPGLKQVGLNCFRNMVYQTFKVEVTNAVLFLISQEREGVQIDSTLLKDVLLIFVEIGSEKMEIYENDFEALMLKDTGAFYSEKASKWILDDSCPEYMIKAEDCLKQEKDRNSRYLHSTSEQKLLEVVQRELLFKYEIMLLENKHSGFHALLRDDKADDLSRMYRLFSKITRGLDPMCQMFKQHITSQIVDLMKQMENDAINAKDLFEEATKLHGKFLVCVNDCFENKSVFLEAFEEAFKVFPPCL